MVEDRRGEVGGMRDGGGEGGATIGGRVGGAVGRIRRDRNRRGGAREGGKEAGSKEVVEGREETEPKDGEFRLFVGEARH